ncbi:MAG TPA: protein-L-isoaspartate(D-aspartate) O-methyltransferase [Thermoanaerobaculia bacterium]|nr:protein-L-isoaspartate(D-aspartate) O-methyltransferase [Thermoanaerobaculia bacterium]
MRRWRPCLAWLALVFLLGGGSTSGAEDLWAEQRRAMVEKLRQRSTHQSEVLQPEVLAAMEKVPRHLFVPESLRAKAYADEPLSLSSDRTIYEPYVVALMTSLLDLQKSDKVLEVGTGTGYHAAVLARLAREVYSVEIVPPVASQARQRLQALGYFNVEVRIGDGYQGWAEKGPFDAILLSAAPPHIPKPLIDQLRVGGRMVVPVGGLLQDLLVITKTADGIEKRTVIPVRLTPMKGKVRDGE